MDESYVQVGPDSTGKQIRNLKISERLVDVNGTETFVDRYALVIAIAEPVTGKVLDFDSSEQLELLRDIRTELRILNFLMYEQAGSKLANDPVTARQLDEFTR